MFELIIAQPFGKVLQEKCDYKIFSKPPQLKYDQKQCKIKIEKVFVFATPGCEKVLTLQKPVPMLKKNPEY